MESFFRVASNRTYRLLCKCHLLYDSAFLIDYFDTIAQQEKQKRNKKVEIEFENVENENSRERSNRSQGRKFRLRLAVISYFMVFRILYHTSLWIFDSRISARMQVLLLNPFALERFDSYMQIFLVLYLVFTRDMLHLMYRHNHGLTFRVTHEAIVENRNSFFLKSRFRFSNPIVRFMAGPDDLISKQLLSLGIWISSLSRLIYYIFNMHHLNLIITQLRTHHFSAFDYVIFSFFSTLNLLTIYTMYHTLMIVGINGVLVTIVAYVKLKQTGHFVRRHFDRRRHGRRGRRFGSDFPVASFHRFRAVIASLMHYIAGANRIYGKVLLDFMLTNVPLNSILLAMLFTGQIRDSIRPVVLAILAVQVFILIVMHISAAVLIRRLHRLVKCFFRIIADPNLCVRPAEIVSQQRAAVLWRRNALGSNKKDNNNNGKVINDKCKPQHISLRLRLQIARYVGDFHTNNQYTVNYGKYGAITFAAIQKQIFINIKLILFSYMLYQTKKIAKFEV